jgi:hypothetical protein
MPAISADIKHFAWLKLVIHVTETDSLTEPNLIYMLVVSLAPLLLCISTLTENIESLPSS